VVRTKANLLLQRRYSRPADKSSSTGRAIQRIVPGRLQVMLADLEYPSALLPVSAIVEVLDECTGL
jgi:hypothetical protein